MVGWHVVDEMLRQWLAAMKARAVAGFGPKPVCLFCRFWNVDAEFCQEGFSVDDPKRDTCALWTCCG